MSLCPSTVSSAGLLPADFYFALKSDIAPPQVLSQNANTVSLSGGGGAVNIASTSAVALSTQKTTAITYDTGLLETNVAGILNVGLGSPIGSTRVEGAKIVIQRDPGEPEIEFVKGVAVERIKFDGTNLLMGNVDIQRAVTSSNPTLKLTNTDTSISASLDYDSFSVNLRSPDVPLYLTKTDALGAAETYVVVAAAGNVSIDAATIGTALLNVGGGMIMTSDAALVEFNNAAGVLKGSMGYNVGTDFMDLTGSAGFEIATTAGPINIQAAGDKINLITSGNNIELAANTSGLGVFADVVISSSDGDLDIGIGGNIIMSAGTTGGNITVTANADFSVSSSTVKLTTLPSGSTANQLFYDTSTKDVTYGPAFPAITVQAATGTIALTEAMNRSTYILTGTSATQTFTSAGLAGVAAGWTVYLRNGNNATGLAQDITISINGTATLHTITGTTNSGGMLLYWDGSAIVKYL